MKKVIKLFKKSLKRIVLRQIDFSHFANCEAARFEMTGINSIRVYLCSVRPALCAQRLRMVIFSLILTSCASIEKNPIAIRTHEYGSFEFKQVGLGGFSESCEILYEKKIVHGLFVLPINPLNKEELPSLKNKKIRIKYLVRKLDLLYNALGFVFSIITQTVVVEDCGRTNNRDDLVEQKSVDFMKSFLGKYEKIKALRDEGKLNVKIVNGRMVIVLSTDVLFNVGSKELSFKGKKAIIEITKILSEIEDQKFQVEGHTDNDPFKAEGATNWDLAASRALSVLNEMIKAGMPSTKISAASFGDARPLVANDTPSNKKQNRRIEIVVLPDIESLPGYE